MLLPLLLACTPATPQDSGLSHDGGAPLDGGSSTDGGAGSDGGSATDGGAEPTWTGLAACSDLRLLATDGDRELAMSLPVDTTAAVTTGEPEELTLAATEGTVLLMQEIAAGDVCGSIEDFPPFGSSTPWWRATAGSVQVRVEPDAAWGFDDPALWDGTELATVTVEASDLRLEPQATAVDDVDLPPFTFDARLARLDLPAR